MYRVVYSADTVVPKSAKLTRLSAVQVGKYNSVVKGLKILVIKEICSWLPPGFGLDGRKVCSQKHISVITNIFKNDFAFIFQFQHKGY